MRRHTRCFVLCGPRLSTRLSRRGGRQSQTLPVVDSSYFPLPVLLHPTSRRQRRTVTGGELESHARLAKSRTESRSRSPSTGAVQVVRAVLIRRNPRKVDKTALPRPQHPHGTHEHHRRKKRFFCDAPSVSSSRYWLL